MRFGPKWLPLLILLLSAGLQGQTLFSTFGNAEAFSTASPGFTVGGGVLAGFPVEDGGLILASAFTPAQSANLSRIDLGMEYVYDPVRAFGPADLNVTLAADQGGWPGAPIETIAVTGALSSISNAVGIVSAASVLQPFLQAGTQYWIVVAPPDLRNTFFSWFQTSNSELTNLSTGRNASQTWEGEYYNTAQAFAVFGAQNAGPQPALAMGGVVDAAAFGPVISPGSWMAIFGSNLSPVTRSWQSADFAGGALPLSLSGVNVQIHGVPAAVSYVSPGQINAQVPDGIGPGPVTVQVITPSGASGLAQVYAAEFAPAFFTFGSGGAAYVAATSSSGSVVISAKSGDVISLYGTGFGATTPAIPSGQLFSGAAPLTSQDQLTITIGGLTAPVAFAGLSEAGVYQFNLTVPSLMDGDQLVIAALNGVSTQAGVYLTVQN